MEPPLWQCAIAVQTDPNIFFHCRPVDGATVMATKLVVEIGDAASRAGLSRVGYFIQLNAARWTGTRLVIYNGKVRIKYLSRIMLMKSQVAAKEIQQWSG